MKENLIFNIAVEKDSDSDSDFGVTVLDLPGCYSAGKTLDEALDSAKEAIRLHLEDEYEDVDKLEIRLAIANYNEEASRED